MKKAALIIHGFLGSPTDFGNLHKTLENKYDFVKSLVLPGHEEKENNDYNDFKASATMQFVLDEYDLLKNDFDQIDVIGHSMGGTLSVYLASKRKVHKLVLLAPALKFLNIDFPIERLTFLIKNSYKLTRARQDKNERVIEKVKHKFEIVKYDDDKSFDFFKRKYLKKYLPKAFKQFVLVTKKVLNEVKSFDSQLLVMWGKLDQLVPIESIEYAESLCTNENKKVIIHDDVSHLMLNTLIGDKLIEEIVSFLES